MIVMVGIKINELNTAGPLYCKLYLCLYYIIIGTMIYWYNYIAILKYVQLT